MDVLPTDVLLPRRLEAVRLQSWGQELVSVVMPMRRDGGAEVEFYRVDTAKCIAEKLEPGTGKQLLALASGPGDIQLALVQSGGALEITKRTLAGWVQVEDVPTIRRSASEKARLLSDGHALAIVDEEEFWYLDDGTWVHMLIPFQPDSNPGGERDILLREKQLFVADDFGEFGGGLLVFDFEPSNGTVRVSEALSTSMEKTGFTSLALDQKRRVWATRRASATPPSPGTVLSLGMGDWRTELSLPPSRSELSDSPKRAPTPIDVDFDDQDSAYVLVSGAGVMTQEGSTWTFGKASWPSFRHEDEELGIEFLNEPKSMKVVGRGMVLLAAGARGLIIFDLAAGTLYPVRLATSH